MQETPVFAFCTNPPFAGNAPLQQTLIQITNGYPFCLHILIRLFEFLMLKFCRRRQKIRWWLTGVIWLK